MGPFGLGVLGFATSLSLLQPGVPVSPPHPAYHGGDKCRAYTAASQLRHGQDEHPQEHGSASPANAIAPCPSEHPLLGTCPLRVSSATRCGEPAPSGAFVIAESPGSSPGLPLVTGHLLSPGVSSQETEGSGGRAACFRCAGSCSTKAAAILFINSNLPLEH